MVSTQDSLVSEMIIIRAVSGNHKKLWTAVFPFCSCQDSVVDDESSQKAFNKPTSGLLQISKFL